MRRARVVLIALVLTAGMAGPAWAADAATAPDLPTGTTPGAGPGPALPHCVVTAVAEPHPAPVAPPRCFATFAEAVAEATEGRVQLPADATTLDQRTLDAADRLSTNAATVIGIEYEHKSFGGWSYVIQATNSRGCVGYSYRVSSLPSSRNNEISSALTYSGCKSRHYSGVSLTGSSYLCGCAQMGSMNDRTSSIYFSATG